MLRARGVRFFLVHFCSPPPELHKTGTIRKHWNRATKYAKTGWDPQADSEIHALVCGLKIAVNTWREVQSFKGSVCKVGFLHARALIATVFYAMSV